MLLALYVWTTCVSVVCLSICLSCSHTLLSNSKLPQATFFLWKLWLPSQGKNTNDINISLDFLEHLVYHFNPILFWWFELRNKKWQAIIYCLINPQVSSTHQIYHRAAYIMACHFLFLFYWWQVIHVHWSLSILGTDQLLRVYRFSENVYSRRSLSSRDTLSNISPN